MNVSAHTRPLPHRLLTLTACGLVSALVLTACGGNGTSTSPDRETSTIAAQAVEPAERSDHIIIPEPELADPEPSASPSDSPDDRGDHDDAASLHVMVNKHNPLDPIDFVPENLVALPVAHDGRTHQIREEAAEDLVALFDAAAADGAPLKVISSYRSYVSQPGTHQQAINRNGRDIGQMVSARPGYSEHQTGLAVDVVGTDGACPLYRCFADTPGGQWLDEHAAEYGWIIRYPQDQQDITGYFYEPWHLRYLGREEAQRVMDAGGILEEAWGYDPAPGYPGE